jgi:uncharacterized protein YqcC (DUF446 family)
MSVLNQMLRDLDARQAIPPQVAPLLKSAVVATDRSAVEGKAWLAVLLCLFGVIIGWFYLSADAVPAPSVSLQSDAPALAPASRPAVSAPALVAVTTSLAQQASDPPVVDAKTPAAAQAVTPAPVVAQRPQPPSPYTSTHTSTRASTHTSTRAVAATELSAMTAEPGELLQANHQQVIAQPAMPQAADPEQQREPAGGQLSIEPVTAADSVAVPAGSLQNQGAGMSLSEATLPALAAQLQQLQLWQQAKNWSALLAAVTPALRQQYPQQVLALEAYAAGQLGDHQRALQAAQLWTQQSPADGRAWLAQAIALDQLAQPTQARLFYQRALQLAGLSAASQQYIRQRLASGG